MFDHFSTAAKGAERFYRTEVFRNESPSLARELDDRILSIYEKHNDQRIITNDGPTFEDTLNSVIDAIADKLDITDFVVSDKVKNIPKTISPDLEQQHSSAKERKRVLNKVTDDNPNAPDPDEETKVQGVADGTESTEDSELTALRIVTFFNRKCGVTSTFMLVYMLFAEEPRAAAGN